jgi:hypothetical protein
VKFQPKVLKIWRDIPTKSGYLPVFLNDSFVPEILPAVGGRKAWAAFINISSNDASGNNNIFPPPSAFTLIGTLCLIAMKM